MAEKQRVTGFGGFFFRAKDPDALAAWYEENLGIDRVPSDYDTEPWHQNEGPTVFAPFQADTAYFGEDKSKAFMTCDRTGFVQTGANLENLDLVKAGWSIERMPSEYETSWPRVYAVGDVRAGSVKRVASAVGQGSVVVSHIHRAIAELDEE